VGLSFYRIKKVGETMEKIIRAYKVNMNMDYSEYAKAYPNATIEDKHNFVTKFTTDLANGPLDEIIKFFNLDNEDIEGLRTDNYAVGYNIINDDEENHNLTVRIRLDIKVSESRENDDYEANPGEGDTLVLEAPEDENEEFDENEEE
jgi:hypothetical protein